MLVTLILSLVMMAGLFLMLYAAVALIQDKRLFTSAPCWRDAISGFFC